MVTCFWYRLLGPNAMDPDECCSSSGSEKEKERTVIKRTPSQTSRDCSKGQRCNTPVVQLKNDLKGLKVAASRKRCSEKKGK